METTHVAREVFLPTPLSFSPLLTAEQVATYLSCSRNSVGRWAKSGALRSFRLGQRDLRFRQEDVDDFLLHLDKDDGSHDRDLGYGRGSNQTFDYEGGKMRSSGPVVKTPKGYVIVTDRQIEVLAATSTLHSMSEAGYMLGMTEHAVKNQLSHLYRRLSVDNRSEALAMVGWLKVPRAWAPKSQDP